MVKILFIGAHPDDIELGAAGLVVQCCESQDFDVNILIMTDNENKKQIRRDETVKALLGLSVDRKKIHFAGFKDGSLHNIDSADAVNKIKSIAKQCGINAPDIVVTHTHCDAHLDHTSTNLIVQATFIDALFAFFSIHVSGTSEFTPNFFIKLEGEYVSLKDKAILCHNTQQKSITRSSLEDYEHNFAKCIPDYGGRAEAFYIMEQNYKADCLKQLLFFSGSSFHTLTVT